MGDTQSRERSITLALISAQLDTILKTLAEYHEELKEFQHEQDALKERQHSTETEIARIKERLGIFSGIAVLISGLISAAISALTRK